MVVLHPTVALAIALQIAGISSADEVVAPTLVKSTSLLALSAGRVRLSLVDGDYPYLELKRDGSTASYLTVVSLQAERIEA